jgi:hypothetical protein
MHSSCAEIREKTRDTNNQRYRSGLPWQQK